MRTVHGIEVERMQPHEREFWLRRYTELLADAERRRDSWAIAMYRREVAKLL